MAEHTKCEAERLQRILQWRSTVRDEDNQDGYGQVWSNGLFTVSRFERWEETAIFGVYSFPLFTGKPI